MFQIKRKKENKYFLPPKFQWYLKYNYSKSNKQNLSFQAFLIVIGMGVLILLALLLNIKKQHLKLIVKSLKPSAFIVKTPGECRMFYCSLRDEYWLHTPL